MRRIGASIIAIVSLAICATGLLAQSGLGDITGHVTDSSGAVLPGATVTATNVETGVRSTAETNSVGIYQIPNLNPGTYSVQALAPNFKLLIREHILVQAEDRIGLDFKLQVGASDQTVTVTAEQSQLRKEDAQSGEVITDRMIETLPSLNRDPFSLLTMAGNVQGGGGRAGWSLGDNGSITSGQGDTRINGGRTGAIEYMVDGVPATGGFVHNVVNDTPAIDAVEEFKVITNGISAEYGRLSGGLLSVSTKSGTNAFHGQLFEYNQNAFLNANTWNNDALCANDPKGNAVACSKANFRQNIFGVAIGGPIWIPKVYNGKSRSFFFANWEATRHSTSGAANVGQTITDSERNGDLTDIGVGTDAAPYAQIWDPYGPVSATPQLDPDGNMFYKRLQLAGGDGRHIPSGELDPVIQQYLKYMPHPNKAPIAGSGTAGNYIIAQPNKVSSDVWAVRLDHVFSDRQRAFGRFTHNGLNDQTAPWYPTLGTSTGTVLDGGFGAEFHYDFTISNTTFLELRAGGNFSPFSQGSFLPTTIQSSTFPYGPAVQALLGPSDIVRISQGPFTEGTTFGCGACQFSQGFNGNTGSLVNSTNFEYAGALTKILNRHSLKFGYEGRRYYDNFTQQGQSNTSGGISDGYGFDSEGVTEYIGNNGSEVWSPQGYANGVGQFLLGIDSWVRVTNKLGRSLASNYYAAYLQDDFKVTSKLTLNLGIRWETESPVTERHNNLTVWNPNIVAPFTMASGWTWAGALQASGLTSAQQQQVATPDWVKNGFAPGTMQVVATTEHPSRLATEYHPYNFSPRIGLADQLNTKTVIRGSFAMLYLPTSGNLSTYGDTPGVYYTTTANNQSTQGPPGANTGYVGSDGTYHTPRTVANPWDPTQITSFHRNNLEVSQQAAASGNGVGAMNIHAHMPHEFDWSVGLQRQLPNQWIAELTYSGNYSSTLLTIGNPSHFPKSLYTGGPNGENHLIYQATVPSPTAGQITDNSYTGLKQPLGILEYQYPYYGPVVEEGMNEGTNHYESMQARVERRFANGFQLLFNYTFGKALDDTGGADTSLGNPGQGSGSGGKSFQQVDNSVHSVYGFSPYDETNRVSVFYLYQLPFGTGRTWMAHPEGFGGHLADALAGGWELSGNTSYRSGRPVSFNVQAQNVDQGIYIREIFGSLGPGKTLSQAWNPHATNPIAPSGLSTPPGSTPVFNLSALANNGSAQSFTYGNLPATIGLFRNPGNWTSDLSTMKNFAFSSDGSRYFQIRLEAQNIFNHAGRGSYDNNTGDTTFGYITGPGNTERHMQIGGRLVF